MISLKVKKIGTGYYEVKNLETSKTYRVVKFENDNGLDKSTWWNMYEGDESEAFESTARKVDALEIIKQLK